MARVTTQTARKDYPESGIVKGDTYFQWQLHSQRVQRSKERPKQSQLTGSEKLANAYRCDEQLGDDVVKAECLQDLIAAVEVAVSDIGDVIEEYRESAENLSEKFPSRSEETEEQASELESWQEELESALSDLKGCDIAEVLDIEVESALEFDDLDVEQKDSVMDWGRDVISGTGGCPL